MHNAEAIVREAGSGDAEVVSAVLEASYSRLMAPAYDAGLLALALPGMTTANPALLTSGRYFVAEVPAHGVVACGGWSHEKPGTGDSEKGHAHIRHFATHPGWIGRGLGRGLYHRCETTARAEGVAAFTCFSSLNAESFYRALGFAVVEQTEITVGNGVKIPSVHMRRVLGEPAIRPIIRTHAAGGERV